MASKSLFALLAAAFISSAAVPVPVAAHEYRWEQDDISRWCDKEDHSREKIFYQQPYGAIHGCGKQGVRTQCRDGTETMRHQSSREYLMTSISVFRQQLIVNCWHMLPQPDYALWVCADGKPAFMLARGHHWLYAPVYVPAVPAVPEVWQEWWLRRFSGSVQRAWKSECEYSPEAELAAEYSFLPLTSKPHNLLAYTHANIPKFRRIIEENGDVGFVEASEHGICVRYRNGLCAASVCGGTLFLVEGERSLRDYGSYEIYGYEIEEAIAEDSGDSENSYEHICRENPVLGKPHTRKAQSTPPTSKGNTRKRAR